MIELEYKPDSEKACERMAAWWEGEIIDRPTIQVTAPLHKSGSPGPFKQHRDLRERWMDVEYNIQKADWRLRNSYWGGEILPNFWPNLGPDILAACLGAELQFGESTSWSEPILSSWGDRPGFKIQRDNIYFKALMNLTKMSLEVGKGKFITGMTDFHPGGDLLLALMGSQQLCMDMIDAPEQVKKLAAEVKPAFYELYQAQHALLLEAGQTLTSGWLTLFSKGKYHIPSNDFSIMISSDMFKEFFLEDIQAEIEWVDRSVYHLDGVGALKHLDALLEIDQLDAIQFVWGAGKGPAHQWMHVFKKIQSKGKNMYFTLEPEDKVEMFIEELDPEGVMMRVNADSVEEAEALIGKISKWTKKGVGV